ncbi:MAG: LysR family transcriptional regulator, partial [Roseiarcus sp.]
LTMMLVAGSDAIAPLSVEAAKFACQGLAPGALTILPTDFSIVVQPYSLIALRHRDFSPAAQAVYEIIRAQALARGGAGAAKLRA